MHTYIHTHTHISYTYSHIPTHNTHTVTYTNKQTNTHIHIHIHTHIHTYIHTYTQVGLASRGHFDTNIYGPGDKDKFANYVTSISASDEPEQDDTYSRNQLGYVYLSVCV